MRKLLLLLLISLIVLATAYGQVPTTMSYQGF